MSWPSWSAPGALPGVVAAPAVAAPMQSALLPNTINSAPAVMPPGMQYSPEQWAQMQQQNWQQWAQWQQQYQQWHQQYGAEYQKSMNAIAGGLPPPMANTGAPLPPPNENKPPPPPDEPPVGMAGVQLAVGAGPQALMGSGPQPLMGAAPQPLMGAAPQPLMGAGPQPLMSQQLPLFNTMPPKQPGAGGYTHQQFNRGPQQNQYGNQRQNWQNNNNKRPMSQGNEFDNKRQMLEVPNNQFGNQNQPRPNQWQTQPPPVATQPPPVPTQPPPVQSQPQPPKGPTNLEELSEAEKKFDKEFAAWEAQFNRWKEQNVNHPDKTQYSQYEKKWESWRNSLLERREQMRKKRISLQAAAAAAASAPIKSSIGPNFNQPPPGPQPLPSDRPKLPPPDFNISESTINPYGRPSSIDSPFSKPPPTQNNEPLNFKPPQGFPGDEIPENMEDDGGEGFLKSASSTGGIPGLDLVKEDDGSQEKTIEEEHLTNQSNDKDRESGSALTKGPDFDAISKGINTILGDQKLLSMLSMVSQNPNFGTVTANTTPKVSEFEQGFKPPNLNAPPPNFTEGPPPTLGQIPPYNERSNNSYEDQYGQRETVNNFDDQTRMSFPNGPNDQEMGFGGGNNFNRNQNRFGNRNEDLSGFGGRSENDQFNRNNYGRNDSFNTNFKNQNQFGQINNSGQNPNLDGNMPDNRKHFNESYGRGKNSNQDGHFNRNDFGDRGNSFNNGDNFDRNNRGDNFNGNNRDNFNRGGNYDNQFGRDNFSHDHFDDNGDEHYDQDSGYHRDDYNDYTTGDYNDEEYNDQQGYNDTYNEEQCNEEYNEEEDFDKYHEMFNDEDPNQMPLEDTMQNAPDPPSIQPVEEPLFEPTTVIDYEHKSLKPVEPEVSLEPIYTFDYRHKPVNRIPYPQRPRWLTESVKNIREFDPLATRVVFERPLIDRTQFERPFDKSRDPGRFVPGENRRDNFPPPDSRRTYPPVEKRRSFPPSDRRDDYSPVDNKRDRYSPVDRRTNFRDERLGSRRSYEERNNDRNREADKESGPNRYRNSDADIKFERRSDRRGDERHKDDDTGRRNRYDQRDFGRRNDDRPRDRDDRVRKSSFDNRKQDFEELSDEDMDWDGEKNNSKSVDRGRGRLSPDLSKATNPVNPAVGIQSQVTMIEDIINPPGRYNRPPRIVIILRGPPGSGKTFLAKLIKDKEVENGGSAPRILSLDDYFMVEHEKEIVEDGKLIKLKEMVYEYEAEMEDSYRQSFIKSFKKTITDGYFPFIVVDNVNDKVKYFGEMWSFAKQNGFQVYICEMDLDPQLCTKRNIHNRNEADIEECIAAWEPTPSHHPILDASAFLQDVPITEVEMEEVNSIIHKVNDEGGPEDEVRSKWDTFDCSLNNLAKLDGVSKPLRPSRTMEEFLQLEDGWEEPTKPTKPGQKRVRWADLEEQRQQKKMRAIGFVVGHTNWNRMMDPTNGGSALTQTKYIERVNKGY